MLVDDRPIRDRHVVAGRVATGGEITFDELHFTGSFVSTTPHLEPLRAVLDEHLGGEVVLIGTNAGRFTPLPAGAVSFFDGTTATGSILPGVSLTGTYAFTGSREGAWVKGDGGAQLQWCLRGRRAVDVRAS